MHKPTLVLTGVVIGLATLCGVQRTHEFERAVKLDTVYASTEIAAKRLEVRKVYPHSLIPGGVRNIDELKWRITQDPSLADWYRGFNWGTARTCVLQPGRFFVTTRNTEHIGWSSQPVERGGQSCITDGTRTILTKCGNEVLIAQETTDEANFPPYEIEAPVYEEIEVPRLTPSVGTTPIEFGRPETSVTHSWFAAPVWGVHNPQPSEPVCADPIEFGKSCS